MLTQPSLLDLAKLLTAHHPTSPPRSTSLFLLAFPKPHPKAMPTPTPGFPSLPHGDLPYSFKKAYHSFPLKLTHALHDSIYQTLYQVTCSTSPKHPSPTTPSQLYQLKYASSTHLLKSVSPPLNRAS